MKCGVDLCEGFGGVGWWFVFLFVWMYLDLKRRFVFCIGWGSVEVW